MQVLPFYQSVTDNTLSKMVCVVGLQGAIFTHGNYTAP